jgi:oligopeptide transport system substrate-binding protein
MKRAFAFGFMLLLAVGLGGLAREEVLRWNLGADPGTIDPSYAVGAAAEQIDHALFLGLTEIDTETLAVIPRLANAWEVSEDNLNWTFHLRQDAMWSDGTPVTAHDITFAIERTLDPGASSPLVRKLYVLAGAQAYHTGAGRARDIGVRAVDNHTVRFTLSRKDDCFPVLVSHPVFYPQPRSIVEDYGSGWTEPEHIVTDGPYVLGQRVSDRIVLYRSATYCDADKVDIDEVRCYTIADFERALAMYRGGELDVIPVTDVAEIEADPAISDELHICPQAAVIGPGCLLSYPAAQLTKPYIVRTYAPLGREKWEEWEILPGS